MDKIKFLFTSLIVISSLSCSEPNGKGIAVGKIFVIGCNENFNYGNPEAAYFNLQTNFVASEPVLDESIPSDSNRLDIRLQKEGNSIDDSDSLYFQIMNTAKAARHYANWQPMPVGIDENIKSSLSLYLTCPDYFDGPEAQADATSCPEITPEEYKTICDQQKYGSLEQPLQPIYPFHEGQSCIIFCSFGKAEHDGSISDTFAINFGDTVSGVYFLTLKNRHGIYGNPEICFDGKDNDNDGIVDEDSCETITSGGFIQGNFKVKAIRSKSLITFP